jgi:hypothetical protein
MSIEQEALQAADEVIAGIKEANGLDYTPVRDDIAKLFHEDLFNGNWDSSTDFDPVHDLPDLRIIEENEYDQSMDNDPDRPEDEIGYFAGHYVFEA